VIYFRDFKKFTNLYGNFEKLNRKDLKKFTVTYTGLNKNVTGLLRPEIVKTLKELDFVPKKILLDGDSKYIVDQFKETFNFDSADVLTTGIGENFDFEWDFENDPPNNIKVGFDLIISQAMFEHLINPYKHLVDLVSKLNNNGIIIIHTVVPGFPYHRYPIDSVRFFPDFFEKSSLSLGLNIYRKFLRDFHIVYVFKK
jgi:SAM-dependent methyltransferase